MTFEEFEVLLNQVFPDGEVTNVADDTGEISLRTGMRVKNDGTNVSIVPMNEPLPENVIVLTDHPKFQAAHHVHDIEEILPPDLEGI